MVSMDREDNSFRIVLLDIIGDGKGRLNRFLCFFVRVMGDIITSPNDKVRVASVSLGKVQLFQSLNRKVAVIVTPFASFVFFFLGLFSSATDNTTTILILSPRSVLEVYVKVCQLVKREGFSGLPRSFIISYFLI